MVPYEAVLLRVGSSVISRDCPRWINGVGGSACGGARIIESNDTVGGVGEPQEGARRSVALALLIPSRDCSRRVDGCGINLLLIV
jgi:hypothetical protein